MDQALRFPIRSGKTARQMQLAGEAVLRGETVLIVGPDETVELSSDGRGGIRRRVIWSAA